MLDMEEEMYKKLLPRSADWQRIAFDLGFDLNTVKVISLNNQHDVNTCLRVVCANWVQKYPDRSLKVVDEVLNSLQTSNSVPQTRKNGCHWFYILSVIILMFVLIILVLLLYYIHTLSLYPVELAPLDHEFHYQPVINKYTTTSEYNISVNRTIVDSIEHFEVRFVYLLSCIQVALNRYIAADTKKVELLGRFLSNCFNVPYKPVTDHQGIDQIDTLFEQIKQLFNFMDTSLLRNLDETFLSRHFSSSLASYEESLDQFMSSTPIINLTNLVWTVHTEQNNVEIDLKLGRNWNNKNLKNLQKLKEYVFGADASLMRLISIHHSVLTVTYVIPKSLEMSVHLVASNVQHNFILVRMSVQSLSIGGHSINMQSSIYDDISEGLVDVLHIEGKEEQFYVSNIQFLVDIGANVNYTDSAGRTPLMVAVVSKIHAAVATLLDLNADPNVYYNKLGYTSLHMSIILEDIECVKIHLEFGVDPNTRTKDKYGYSYIPLLIAASRGHLEIMKLLLNKNAKVNSLSGVKLVLSSLFSEQEIYQQGYFSLVNMLYCTGISPLLHSIHLNNVDLVKLLLEHGADPNSCLGTFSALGIAIDLQQFKIVDILLEHNASVNGLYDVHPPLVVAVSFDHVNIVETLLDHGADINIQVDTFRLATPLLLATLNGNIRMVELLLMKGANVTLTNTDGLTAIDIANYELKINFKYYSPLSIEMSQRYLMIKKLLSFYVEKQLKQKEDDSEQLLSSSETKYTHSYSSIYELVYEVEYVLPNESFSAIGFVIDFLRSVIFMRNYSKLFVL